MEENSSVAINISDKTHLHCDKICVKQESESHWVNALQKSVLANWDPVPEQTFVPWYNNKIKTFVLLVALLPLLCSGVMLARATQFTIHELHMTNSSSLQSPQLPSFSKSPLQQAVRWINCLGRNSLHFSGVLARENT